MAPASDAVQCDIRNGDADQGGVIFAGRDVTRMPAHARTRLGMARTFQNLALFSEMSVINNVRVGAHMHSQERAAFSPGMHMRSERGRGSAMSWAMPRACWTSSGSCPTPSSRRTGLRSGISGSLKWRVRWRRARGFCCSTSRRPALIQPSWKLAVLLIRRIRETYALSVLLIGHTMRLVMGLWDRIIVLDHGVRLAEGSPREIGLDARVIAAYLGALDAA